MTYPSALYSLPELSRPGVLGLPEVKRNFIQLAGVNQYFDVPMIVSRGDHVIEFDFQLNLETDQKYLGPGSSDKTGLIGIDSDGSVVTRIGRNWVQIGRFYGAAGVIYNLRLTRAGSTNSVRIGDTSVGEFEHSGDWVVESAGRAHGTSVQYARGIIANLRITGGNITSGGEPVDELFYPLDDKPDNFPVIREAINGKNGTFINGSVDAYGEFTKQADGNWLGSDLSVPPWDSEDQSIEVSQ